MGPLRIVDGAVFENSGIETAMDLITELRHYDDDLGPHRTNRPAGLPRVRFTLIALHNFDDYRPRNDRPPSGFTAPIQALLSARAARASFALSRADDSLCGQRGVSCMHPTLPHYDRRLRPLVPIYLDHVDNALALGWHLSGDTRRLIENQVSSPAACRLHEIPPAPSADIPNAQRVAIHNGCSACFILARLAPDPQAAMLSCGQGADGNAVQQPAGSAGRVSAGGPGP